MFRGLPRYSRTRPSDFWESAVPASWAEMPGLAVLEENRRTNKGLVESQVLSLSYGKVIVKPVEKQRGLVPESYEGYQVLNPGDIVVRPTDLQNDQTSIRVGHVRDRGIITSAYIGLRPRGEWTDGYAFHYLAVVDSSKLIYGMGSGLRQQLGWGDLKRMPCLVPPVEEQAAIVKYLAHANARIGKAIAAKHRLIALLEEQMRASIDATIEASTREVGATMIPLKRLVVGGLRYGANEPGEGGDPGQPRYIRITDFGRDGQLRDETFVSIGWDIAEKYPVIPGDILFARSGGTVGKAFLAPPDLGPACHAGYLIKARCNTALLLPEYLYEFTRSSSFSVWRFETLSQATIENISADKYGNLLVPVPPLHRQRTIVAKLALEHVSVERAIQRVRREIALLHEFRTRLVSDVVTGQVDVRAVAASLPDAAVSMADVVPELDDDLEAVLSERGD